MKSKQVFVGILAIVLVFSLVLTGCDTGTGDDSENGGTRTYTVEVKSVDSIMFHFVGAYTDLTLADITITDGTGAISDARLGNASTGNNETTYELFYTTITAGTITIKITKPGIDSSERTLTVHKRDKFIITVTGLTAYAGSTIQVYFTWDIGLGHGYGGYHARDVIVGADGTASVDYSDLLHTEQIKYMRVQKIPIYVALNLEKKQGWLEEYWYLRLRSKESFLISDQEITVAYSAETFKTR
jgi:predicted small secreted protein